MALHKNTLRYDPPKNWYSKPGYNNLWFGLVFSVDWMFTEIFKTGDLKLLEIGVYKGESTSVFASSGIFDKIFCIDPFEGKEKAIEELNDDWKTVKTQFYTNTRHWDNINLIQDYSFNQVNNFPDKYFDVIYMDADHSYDALKRDIEMYLPKCKKVIGGHDYGNQHPDVVTVVNELFGSPDIVFCDGSWFKVLSF